MALRTSASATTEGVVTITAPVSAHGLDQAELHVAGARRQVDDQVIQLAPHHAAQKLLHDAVQHRPAPDHRLVARRQQPHRDQLQAVRFDRHDLPLAERRAAIPPCPASAARSGRRRRHRAGRPLRPGAAARWPGSRPPWSCPRRPSRWRRRSGSSRPGIGGLAWLGRRRSWGHRGHSYPFSFRTVRTLTSLCIIGCRVAAAASRPRARPPPLRRAPPTG